MLSYTGNILDLVDKILASRCLRLLDLCHEISVRRLSVTGCQTGLLILA
jgi:hypothetical protein